MIIFQNIEKQALQAKEQLNCKLCIMSETSFLNV